MNTLPPPAGLSPHPPLSPERIKAARDRHGHAVDKYLDSLQIGDPLADDLVVRFETMERRRWLPMLLQAIDRGIDSVDDAPPELIAMFEQLDHVPFWVEWDRMHIGSGKISRNALLPAMSLAVYALPHAYLATGNKPLVFSSNLLMNTARRYAITTRFITEVFMPGGMRRHADGFKFTVVTRMLHARIRREILRSGNWDSSQGLPLNEAHMAMGIIIFSFYVIVGMRRLGGRISQHDMESILLIWRYVGYLFGINPEMVPTSEADVRHLIEVAFSLDFDPDEDSKKLCKSLIQAAPQFLQFENETVSRLFVGVLYALSRKLLGDELADKLGYPPEKRRMLCAAGISLTWLFERFPILVPRKLRDYMGVRFWLERGDYDLKAYGIET